MRLLSSIQNINPNDEVMVDRVLIALQDRLSWLEDREPEYDGIVHDDWEEKYDDLEDIINLFDDLEEDQSIWKDIVDYINIYQTMHKGLSRIEI